MNGAGILFKLSWVPLRRSWFLLGVLGVSLAQIFLALWLCGGVFSELRRTEAYADRSRFVTIQLRDESVLVDPIKELLSGEEISIEELKTGQVLERMEAEEPEIVQTIRSVGGEGSGLVPRLLLARGPIPDPVIEKLRLMTEVSRVDLSPVHHARLKSFYSHLAFEMRIAVGLILFLVIVQVLVGHRILRRDSGEISRNLIAWGARGPQAYLPGFGAMMILVGSAFFISIGEWSIFRNALWKDNSFLGELSVDRDLAFPLMLAAGTGIGTFLFGAALSFSSRISRGSGEA
jgi:hypothetical protein